MAKPTIVILETTQVCEYCKKLIPKGTKCVMSKVWIFKPKYWHIPCWEKWLKEDSFDLEEEAMAMDDEELEGMM